MNEGKLMKTMLNLRNHFDDIGSLGVYPEHKVIYALNSLSISILNKSLFAMRSFVFIPVSKNTFLSKNSMLSNVQDGKSKLITLKE